MTLARWQRTSPWALSPYQTRATLRDEIDRLFDQAFDQFLESPFAPGASELLGGWGPAVDVYEDKDSLTVKAELPGMKKEDIEISMHDGFLSISGERKQVSESAEPHRSERFFGRFQRTLSIPAKVDPDKIKATYKDGILTVVMPKAEEAKPKQIPVNVR